MTLETTLENWVFEKELDVNTFIDEFRKVSKKVGKRPYLGKNLDLKKVSPKIASALKERSFYWKNLFKLSITSKNSNLDNVLNNYKSLSKQHEDAITLSRKPLINHSKQEKDIKSLYFTIEKIGRRIDLAENYDKTHDLDMTDFAKSLGYNYSANFNKNPNFYENKIGVYPEFRNGKYPNIEYHVRFGSEFHTKVSIDNESNYDLEEFLIGFDFTTTISNYQQLPQNIDNETAEYIAENKDNKKFKNQYLLHRKKNDDFKSGLNEFYGVINEYDDRIDFILNLSQDNSDENRNYQLEILEYAHLNTKYYPAFIDYYDDPELWFDYI